MRTKQCQDIAPSEIDLLKYLLTDYHHAGVIEYKPMWVQRNKPTMMLLKYLDSFLRKYGFCICYEHKTSKFKRENGLDWGLYADTMIGLKRLTNVQELFEKVCSEKIQGDLIETGVWRGGACIFMRALIQEYGDDRNVWVCDSFCGLPEPSIEQDKNMKLHTRTELAISLETVKENFAKYRLLDDKVIFLNGWFRDTLPTIPKDQKFAIIRLDGDMYESTMDALVNLYPKLSVGGYCIIDDYLVIEECRKAVSDYTYVNNIQPEIINIDDTAIYWRK